MLWRFLEMMLLPIFYDNRDKDLDELRNKHTKSSKKNKFNAFHLAQEIIRQKFRYQMCFIKGRDLFHIAKKYKGDVLYVQIHGVSSAFTHVVCIWNELIVDGTLQSMIYCNEESMKWLIKEDHFTFVAYRIQISSKVERILKSADS